MRTHKPHRINARMSAEEFERAREILASHKIYGVHSLSDVVSKAVWDLYDAYFPKVLMQPVVVEPPPAALAGAEHERRRSRAKRLDSAAKKPGRGSSKKVKGGAK